MSNPVEKNIKGLQNLIKALSGDMPFGKVGILSGGSRKEGGITNATVGAAHEYGTSILPRRSFLREPLEEVLPTRMYMAGFNPEALRKVIAEKSIREWVEKITIMGESIVLEAFASNGFGKWAPHAPGYKNNTGQILVDTHQLRDSITSEVVE